MSVVYGLPTLTYLNLVTCNDIQEQHLNLFKLLVTLLDSTCNTNHVRAYDKPPWATHSPSNQWT